MNHTIEIAESCGFCFGVRRAVEMVYDLRHKTDKRIYVIGELIHNGIFIERLKKDGIFCLESEADIDAYVEKMRQQLKQLMKGCDGIQLK